MLNRLGSVVHKLWPIFMQNIPESQQNCAIPSFRYFHAVIALKAHHYAESGTVSILPWPHQSPSNCIPILLQVNTVALGFPHRFGNLNIVQF